MAATPHPLRMTTAGSFWYILGCISFGASYFAKVPVKKAFEEAGLAQMTSAEKFWYVLQCIAFGSGYFAKLPVRKALSEMIPAPAAGYGHGGSQVYQQLPQPGSGPPSPAQNYGLPVSNPQSLS
jgi:hypothetical protein